MAFKAITVLGLNYLSLISLSLCVLNSIHVEVSEIEKCIRNVLFFSFSFFRFFVWYFFFFLLFEKELFVEKNGKKLSVRKCPFFE